jgi:hypothetical protein
MIKQLAALGLLVLAFGTLQPAAQALEFNFGRHDYNHDGRWNYSEYNRANQYYYGHRRHRHDFDRLDRNHDGYLNQAEVRTYYR